MKLRVGVVLLASSAVFGLAACGGGESEVDGEASSPTKTAAAEGATPGQMNAPQSPAAAEGGADGGVVLAGLTGDAVRGQRVFMQCRACHAVQPGVKKVGPTLHGVIGRTAGTVPNFRYSPAIKNSGVIWSEANLFEYLENPRQYMPGTIMSYAGLKNPQQRADVIAYIKSSSASAT